MLDHVAAELIDQTLRIDAEHRAQRAKLSSLQIEELFDPLLISGEVGFRKPDARIFELAIASWGLPRDSPLFVGDDPVSDIGGATQAGMRALRIGADGISSILSLEAWLNDRRS